MFLQGRGVLAAAGKVVLAPFKPQWPTLESRVAPFENGIKVAALAGFEG